MFDHLSRCFQFKTPVVSRTAEKMGYYRLQCSQGSSHLVWTTNQIPYWSQTRDCFLQTGCVINKGEDNLFCKVQIYNTHTHMCISTYIYICMHLQRWRDTGQQEKTGKKITVREKKRIKIETKKKDGTWTEEHLPPLGSDACLCVQSVWHYNEERTELYYTKGKCVQDLDWSSSWMTIKPVGRYGN